MMNDALCTYGGRRDEVLVAYLYDDIDPIERDAFESHLTACLPCRSELQSLADVRSDLAAWAAPATAAGVGGTAPRSPLRLVDTDRRRTVGGWRVIADAPIWLQAAAAMLVVAASLGIANINLTYSREGLTLTTGWRRPQAPVAVGQQSPSMPAADVAAENAELRAQVSALRQQVDEIKAQTASAVSRPDDGAVARQVRTQLQESERRQQREFDLRFAEMARDFQVQRQADLVKVDRALGVVQSRTGMQVLQQQQQLNNLLQRVSEQR